MYHVLCTMYHVYYIQHMRVCVPMQSARVCVCVCVCVRARACVRVCVLLSAQMAMAVKPSKAAFDDLLWP